MCKNCERWSSTQRQQNHSIVPVQNKPAKAGRFLRAGRPFALLDAARTKSASWRGRPARVRRKSSQMAHCPHYVKRLHTSIFFHCAVWGVSCAFEQPAVYGRCFLPFALHFPPLLSFVLAGVVGGGGSLHCQCSHLFARYCRPLPTSNQLSLQFYTGS